MIRNKQNTGLKKITNLFVICFVFLGMCFGGRSVARAAASPNNIVSYQGRLLNTNGAPIADATVDVVFRLYDAETLGSCLWSNSSSSCASATAMSITLTDGLFSENLGDAGDGYATIPDSVFRDNASVYLQVDVEGETLLPRKLFTASPYAVNASVLDGIDSAGFLQTTGGTATGAYDFSGAAFSGASPFIFEGATDNGFETTFTVTDPTADNTITFQDASGTVALTSDVKWTDAGTVTYLTSTSDDVAIGGTSLSGSALSVDVSANTTTLGTGSGSNATLVFNASDGDTGNFAYETDDTLYFRGGGLTVDQAFSVSSGLVDLSDSLLDFILMGDGGFFALNDGHNTMFQIVDSGTVGDATVTGTLQVRGNIINGYGGDPLFLGSTSTSYVRIGATGTPASVSSAGDLFVSDDLEVADAINAVSATLSSSAVGATILSLSGPNFTDDTGIAMLVDVQETTTTADIVRIQTDAGSLNNDVFRIEANGGVFTDTGYTVGTSTTTAYSDASIVSTSAFSMTAPTTFTWKDDAANSLMVLTDSGTTGSLQVTNDLTVEGQDVRGPSGSSLRLNQGISQPVLVGSSTGILATGGGDLYVTGNFEAGEGSLIKNSSSLAGFTIIQSGVDAPSSGSVGQQALVLDVFEGTGDNAADEDVMIIRSDADGTPDTEFRFQLDGDALADGSFTGGGADFAEFFLTRDASLGNNDVVCRSVTVANAVERCVAGNHDVVGVVSTNPSFIGNNIPGAERDLRGDSNYRVVGMLGQIDTKVTAADGAIAIGDPVTTSAMMAGYAGKAHGPVQIIGRALEALPSGTGVIKIHVTPSWYAGDVFSGDATTTLVSDDIALAALQTATANATVSDSHLLALRGSVWNGSSAETRQMVMLADVSDADVYGISIRNNVGDQVVHISQSGDLALAGKLYPSDRGQLQTEKYIYYDHSIDGGYMRTNAAGWATGSYDFAEMFPSNDSLAAGEVVIFASDDSHVQRSNGTTYDAKIAGIISTRPGFLAGESGEGNVPVALSGRVPTYVSGENGAIAVGDPLTTSTRPGYAMKATEPGPIVGYAMEPFAGTTGVVTAVVRPSYYEGDPVTDAPEAENAASQLMTVSDLDVAGSLNMNGGRILSVGSLAGIGNAWHLDENGNFVTSGRIATQIHSSQGEDVSTYAVTSTDTLLQLSGTATLSGGTATVDFESIDPHFNDVIAEGAAYRVFLTPSAPTGQLYAVNRTNQGFEIRESLEVSTGVPVDWMVMAYRKDFAPDSALQTVPPDNVASDAQEPSTEDAASSETPSADQTLPDDASDPSVTPETLSGEAASLSDGQVPDSAGENPVAPEAPLNEDPFSPPPPEEEVVPTPDVVP